MNLFVGSLPFRMQEGELESLFSEYGVVSSARIIKDRMSGRSRGYGFVEMPDDEAAARAMRELDGHEVMGRAIVVNEAQPRPERNDRGGYRRNDYDRGY